MSELIKCCQISTSSGPLNYLVSKPICEPPLNGFPILCFLHGYDQAAPAPIEEALTKYGPLNPQNPSKIRESFIIIAPQMPVKELYWVKYENEVKSLIEKIQETEGGDKTRRYLTGFSIGGMGAFDISVKQPNFWAALWAIDPPVPPEVNPERPIWFSPGGFARPKLNEFITVLKLKLFDKDLSLDRLYFDYHDPEHTETALIAYKDATIYEWLLRKYI